MLIEKKKEDYQFLVITSTAFPLYYSRHSIYDFFKDESELKVDESKNNIQLLKSVCQLICISSALFEKGKPFNFEIGNLSYFVVPHQLDKNVVFSCLVARKQIGPNTNYWISYCFLNKLLKESKGLISPFLTEYQAYQDKMLNESTFNDSVGNIYDESYLEEILIRYNLHDIIFNFEDSLKDGAPILQLMKNACVSEEGILTSSVFYYSDGALIPLFRHPKSTLTSQHNDNENYITTVFDATFLLTQSLSTLTLVELIVEVYSNNSLIILRVPDHHKVFVAFLCNEILGKEVTRISQLPANISQQISKRLSVFQEILSEKT